MKTAHAEADLVNTALSSDMTVKDLWLRYLALGGNRSRQELQDYLSGESGWTAGDHDLLAHALNEHLRACGSPFQLTYARGSTSQS
jgi:hypothetical protein